MYRKSLFIIIGLVVLLFVGCKGNDKELILFPPYLLRIRKLKLTYRMIQ